MLIGLLMVLSIASCSRLVSTITSAKRDPQPEPGIHFVSSVKPRLKLQKRLCAFGSDISAGCSYGALQCHDPHARASSHKPLICSRRYPTVADVIDGVPTFEAKVKEALFGGTIGLTNLTRVEWSKTWLYPGLLDAATRVEIQTRLDVSTGSVDAELR
jgi:hypothetical protein